MKKFTKISLHQLSQAELAEKEQMLLCGGSENKCGCWGVCWGEACACEEQRSGGFPSANSNAGLRSVANSDAEATQSGLDNKYQ